MNASATLVSLMTNEARMGSRRFADLLPSLDARGRRIALVIAVLVLHLAAWPAARWIASAEADPARSQLLFGGLSGLLGFAGSWMIAQSLLNVTRALFVRGDLDLMLSAPMPASRIVMSRMIMLAGENFGSSAFFLLPIAHALALQGHVRWLGIYPLLASMSLLAAAIGLGLALLLFNLIGAKRARSVAQVIAMLIGAVVALGIQMMAVLPHDLRQSVFAVIAARGESQELALPLPLAAARGDLWPILLISALSLVFFTATMRVLGDLFTRSALQAAGTDLAAVATTSRKRVRFSHETATSIRSKELRLLLRDPWILGQLFLQIVYTLPVALILWRSGIGQAIPAVAVTPSLVIIAAQLSGSLAWIAISGEDAPEFMATAPVSRAAVELRKLEVIALIVGGTLALPILLLTISTPIGGVIALASCAAIGASCAMVNLWHPTDGRRRSFMRRHAQSKLIGLFEHALLLLGAIAAALAQMHTLVALAPALLAACVLWLAWWVLARKKVARPATSTPQVPLPGATQVAA